ncbi:H-2 class I histocompatibility antigen, L-D alpha chain-like [Pseudoliparis swirei]|uniref:H-2 class I histocompatibility antigen, L-D alpha chain-like n=1 Tax=Pseudoliparis swirei TaxID=2059687 RepID=UPI0024BEA867|nr:H-2 class I histocompatibility antigen, L-D alpha chain-like [Pseudoliparis swirei]
MFPVLLVVLWGAMAANCDELERHSLSYIYTAFSKPVGLPGFHEFTAMGLLDHRMIDYYDSDSKVKVPKQPWMKERLLDDYWEKGTQSRQSKHQWFTVNIDILKTRMRQNDSDLHVLQWRHGCEGVRQPDGTLKFTRGIDMYSYDGNDFLSFDDKHSVWVAPVAAALQTKRKWDEVQVLKEYTKGYLENECMDWMDKFVNYQQPLLEQAIAPKLFVFTRNTKVDAIVALSCMATGFYPKYIVLRIKRNKRVLTPEDGLVSTGTRPNGDDTFQRRDTVEILRTDESTYTCEVRHDASGLHMEEEWDRTLPASTEVFIIGGAVAGLTVLTVLTVVLLLLYKRGSDPSLSSNDSTAASSSSGSETSVHMKDYAGSSGSESGVLMEADTGPSGSESSSLMEAHAGSSGSESGVLMEADTGPSGSESSSLIEADTGPSGSESSA